MVKENDLRIVLIGAGSVSFGLQTLGDLMTVGFEELSGSTIVLHDLSKENLRLTEGVLKKALEKAANNGDPRYFKVESTMNPKEALTGANYCIMSIEHGNRMKTWRQDYYVPRSYGSNQIYGENGGPGGAFHTWRQVPPMLKITEIMEDFCPDAWLLNYSNPVPRVTWALNRASKIKTVGLCHGIMSGMQGLVNILGITRDNFDFISAGLNHFYWIINCIAKNNITLPTMGPFNETKIEKGTDLLPFIKDRGIFWAQKNELSLIEELLKSYGYLTYPEQSHPAEYIPWADSYCPFVKYDFIDYARKGDLEKNRLDETLKGKKKNNWWIKQSGERAVHLIIGMEKNTGQREIAVNVQNNGIITDLPDECVVEVPAIIDKNGIHPEKIGHMPKGISQLLQHEVIVQELVVDAALTGDHNTAIQALSIDGTVPSPNVARSIFYTMLELQKALLPQFVK